MLDTQMQDNETELWDEASNPPQKSYDLFGKVEIKAWRCAFEKGVKGGVPFDPARHQKSHIMIDIFIQPLPEIDVKYPRSLEFHDVTWSVAWTKFVNPSIKALGFENVRDIDAKWARVARVPTGETYDKKDSLGNATGEKAEITTFKFVAFYASEDECRAAYESVNGNANGNGNGHAAPVEDAERLQHRQIMTVVINNVAPGKTTFAEVQEAIKAHAFYPHVEKSYPIDSVETMALITEITKLLPF